MKTIVIRSGHFAQSVPSNCFSPFWLTKNDIKPDYLLCIGKTHTYVNYGGGGVRNFQRDL